MFPSDPGGVTLPPPYHWSAETEPFHQHGHHVQKAHGRRAQLASDGSHLSGAMIALVPTASDAKRLAVKGGEAPEDLHLTLFYLGKGADFPPAEREMIVSSVRNVLGRGELGDCAPLTANVFGIAHWNGGTADASWVWSVGDGPEDTESDVCDMDLEDFHRAAGYALEESMLETALPRPHSPWVAHVCAAYTDDLSLAKELEKRSGPITFDRIRIVFGDDVTDIPLTPSMTAAAGPLRRNVTDTELAARVDFALMDQSWNAAVSRAVLSWKSLSHIPRAQIRAQITEAVNSGNLAALSELDVSTDEEARVLAGQMLEFAESAGRQMQREAEDQGVDVPEWSLSGDAVTAGGARDRIRAFARVTVRLLGLRLVTSASRNAMDSAQEGRSGEEVADDVDADLDDLSEDPDRRTLGAAMTTAQNTGRMAVLNAAPQGTYFASEALDNNSCKPCREIDGYEFSSLKEAEAAYPNGGYLQCQGGDRCRGTMIATWEQGATASAVQTERKAATMAEELGGKPNPGTTRDKRLKKNPSNGAKPEKASLEVPDIPDGSTAPWRGPLAVEGTTTGDGREFFPGSLTWQDLPAPLRWNKEDSHGGEAHTVAVNVGRIDKIYREGDLIMGEGVLNLAEPDGQRVHDMIKGEFIRGVSIDADSITDADVEYIWPEGAAGEDDDPLMMLFAQPEKVLFHAGRIRAATLCDIPAFAEAYIALVDPEGAILAGGRTHPHLVLPQEKARPAVDGLVAHGGPQDENWLPPAEWFTDPKLSLPTGIQITDDGRLYGHAAQWGSCHIGQADVCVQPPREEDHPYYMTGEIPTREGTRVAVGQITVSTGHAPLNMAAGPAAEHYEHTGNAVADVAVGNDEHGIWVSGAIRPGADPMLVHELRASGQVSGDWRRIGGQLRMVGLLAVNVPGFPVPKLKARVASGAQTALVAAGRPTVVHGLTQVEREQQAFRIVMDAMAERIHRKE
jgi:hypothetical protein